MIYLFSVRFCFINLDRVFFSFSYCRLYKLSQFISPAFHFQPKPNHQVYWTKCVLRNVFCIQKQKYAFFSLSLSLFLFSSVLKYLRNKIEMKMGKKKRRAECKQQCVVSVCCTHAVSALQQQTFENIVQWKKILKVSKYIVQFNGILRKNKNKKKTTSKQASKQSTHNHA